MVRFYFSRPCLGDHSIVCPYLSSSTPIGFARGKVLLEKIRAVARRKRRALNHRTLTMRDPDITLIMNGQRNTQEAAKPALLPSMNGVT
jgi:hypothetical protein